MLASTPPQVESKYGESVSIKDVTGCNPAKKLRIGKAMGAHTTLEEPPETVRFKKVRQEGTGATTGTRSPGEGAPVRRKAPTDSSNAAFEEWLRDRKPRDFLAEQVISYRVETLWQCAHEPRVSRRDGRGCDLRFPSISTFFRSGSWLLENFFVVF